MRGKSEGKAGGAAGWREVYLPTINGSGYPLTVESFETEEGAIAWARRWLEVQAERLRGGLPLEQEGGGRGCAEALAMIEMATPSALRRPAEIFSGKRLRYTLKGVY